MLKKQVVKSRNVVKVTFAVRKEELPEDLDVKMLHVVGEFNDWDERANPLAFHKKKKDYRTVLELAPGRSYTFRYLINGQHWCNDWEADEYVSNPFGEDDCVVLTSEIG